jgi:hypothetical protein
VFMLEYREFALSITEFCIAFTIARGEVIKPDQYAKSTVHSIVVGGVYLCINNIRGSLIIFVRQC